MERALHAGTHAALDLHPADRGADGLPRGRVPGRDPRRLQATERRPERARDPLSPPGDVRLLRQPQSHGGRLSHGLRRAAGLRLSSACAHLVGRDARAGRRGGRAACDGETQRSCLVRGRNVGKKGARCDCASFISRTGDVHRASLAGRGRFRDPAKSAGSRNSACLIRGDLADPDRCRRRLCRSI